ncbi:uncharacterized protein LOC144476554 [Augochlora pura]
MDQSVEPIKILANGNKYFVINNPNELNQQQRTQDQEKTTTSEWSSTTNNDENVSQTTDNNKNNNWKEVIKNKKRKLISTTGTDSTQPWLQDIPLSNSFSSLAEVFDMDITEENPHRAVKPPPIYVDAKIIDPLTELLNNVAGANNYNIKQIKLDQVKIQTNTPDNFRNITQTLKAKNAAYHTYQLKTEKSYKAVIRELHPKTNVQNIVAELRTIGHEKHNPEYYYELRKV